MILKILSFLPRKGISHLTGIIVHCESPRWLALTLRNLLIKLLKIDASEAELPLEQYPSFGKFFARRLKKGARPLSNEDFLSPCDGVISESGSIDSGKLTQCKGLKYSLSKLLKNDTFIPQFLEGTFLTIYLAPFNYHRIHVPVTSKVIENYTIEGDLWPVNKDSVSSIDELFCINERNISILSTEYGNCALIMVGATNVGSIELMPKISVGSSINKGDEYGIFHMGSTVILLLDKKLATHLKLNNISLGSIKCLEAINTSI